MARGINKAIPPSPLEFPDYEHQEYPKKLGNAKGTGEMVIAQNAGHEAELCRQYGIPKGADPSKTVIDLDAAGTPVQNTGPEASQPAAPKLAEPELHPAVADEQASAEHPAVAAELAENEGKKPAPVKKK